jgi:hypothetical protein
MIFLLVLYVLRNGLRGEPFRRNGKMSWEPEP